MWIKDLWNRVLAKFKKEDSISEPVMELKTEEAPEPVPERKTSAEMIITMAESVLQDRNETYDGPEPSADRSQSAADTDAPSKGPAGEENIDPAMYTSNWEADTDPADVEDADAGDMTPASDPAYWETDTDPVPDETECEAEADEGKDTE